MVARAKVTIGIATRKVTGIATNIMASPYQTPVASVTGAAIVELGWDHELREGFCEFIIGVFEYRRPRAVTHGFVLCHRFDVGAMRQRAAANKTANLPARCIAEQLSHYCRPLYRTRPPIGRDT